MALADFSFLSQGVQSPLSGLQIGSKIARNIGVALDIKASQRQDQVMQMEQDKINRILDKQKKRQTILSGEGDVKSKADALMREGDLEGAEALQLSEQRRIQIEGAEEATQRADRELDLRERGLDIEEQGQLINSITKLMDEAPLLASELFKKKEVQAAFGMDKELGDQAPDLVRKSILAASQNKNKPKRTVANDQELEQVDTFVSNMGLSPASVIPFRGDFDTADDEKGFKETLGSMALMIVNNDSRIGYKRALSMAAPFVAAGMSDDGKFNPGAVAEYQQMLLTTVAPQPGLNGQVAQPVPAAAVQEVQKLVKEDRLTPQEVAGFERTFNQDPMQYAKSKEQWLEEIRNSAGAINRFDSAINTALDARLQESLAGKPDVLRGGETIAAKDKPSEATVAARIKAADESGGTTVSKVKDADSFLVKLSGAESSFGKFLKSKSGKHTGLFHMGFAARQEGGLQNPDGTWTKEAKAQGITSIKTLNDNPEAQVKAVRKYHKAIETRMKGSVPSQLERALGTKVGDTEITMSGLIAASHLVGEGTIRGILRRTAKIKDDAAYVKALKRELTKAKDGNKGDKRRTPALKYVQEFEGFF